MSITECVRSNLQRPITKADQVSHEINTQNRRDYTYVTSPLGLTPSHADTVTVSAYRAPSERHGCQRRASLITNNRQEEQRRGPLRVRTESLCFILIPLLLRVLLVGPRAGRSCRLESGTAGLTRRFKVAHIPNIRIHEILKSPYNPHPDPHPHPHPHPRAIIRQDHK